MTTTSPMYAPSHWHLFHNPKLWDKTAQPNANIIYHLQSDGKITSQKGGWAYGNRTEFVDSPAVTHRCDVPGVDLSRFPSSFTEFDGRVVHYIMVDKDTAYQLRNAALAESQRSD